LYYKNATGTITYISGGTASVNSFATINVASSLILATTNTDILSFANGGGIIVAGNPSTKTVTHQVTGYQTFLAPFNGALSATQIGAVIQLNGNATIPNANSCPLGGTFTFVNHSASNTSITATGGGDFIWDYPGLSSTSNKVIWLNPGESLQIASRGPSSTEWDVVGGTATLKYTPSTSVTSLVINNGGGGSITFADGTTQTTAASGAALDQTARNLANTAQVLASYSANTANNASANTIYLQSALNSANANIVAVQALANTDYTTLTAAAGVYGNSTFVPVVTLAANGRITSIVNTAITVTSSGGSSSGYLANSVIIANSTGYLSNTSNLLYYSANNTLAIAGNVSIKSANTAISNSATFVFNTTFNSLDTIFG
jgi:hypothetical protein